MIFFSSMLSVSLHSATNTVWTNPAFANWEDSSNWSLGVPDSATDATINNGGAPLISNSPAIANNLFVGYSNNRNNALFVQNNLTTVSCVIGEQANALGSIQLGLMNSYWLNSSDAIIGNSGNASLSLFNGAFASTGDTTLAVQPNSFGAVYIQDQNSTWQNSNLKVGEGGIADLRILDQGIVQSTGTSIIGDLATSNGIVLLDGGSWNNENIIVGNFGTGILTVIDGSSVTTNTSVVGMNSGSIGNIFVRNAGSNWIHSQSLTLGLEGTANIELDSDGLIYAPDIQMHNANFDLKGNSGSQGILKAEGITNTGPSSVINFKGGILQAAADNPDFLSGFSSAQLNVAAEGAFIDTQNFDIGISSPLSGSGPLTKLGSGSLTLSGANTYSGGTIISEGILQGDSISLKGNFQNDSTLVFNQTVDGTFSGLISGSGTLVKDGQAKLQINSDCSNFTGITEILSGTLSVNGSLGGVFHIRGSGVLGGNGIINFVNNQGVIAPGNSIGTLHVNNFVNQSNGTYLVQINDQGQASLIDASGTVTLEGGTLIVDAYPGFYLKGMSWTIIQAAGGLTGQFASTIFPANLMLGLSYFPNSLILNALGNGVDTSCIKGNALRVANYISGLDVFSEDFLNDLKVLNTLNCKQINKALNQLDPALFEALAITAGDTAHMINTTFMDRLSYLRKTCCEDACNPCGEGCGGGWIAGSADFVRQNKSQGLRRFTTASEGVSLGYDNWICDSIVAGLGGGYSHTNLHWGNSAGKAEINSYYAGAYATRYNDIFYVDASLLLFVDHDRVRRHIHFADINRTAKNNHYSYGFSPHFGAGLFWNYCTVDVTPFFDIDYYLVQQNRCREHGADSLDLHVKRNQSQLLRAEIGLDFSKCLAIGSGLLRPNLSISWVGHQVMAGKKYFATFKGMQPNFKVYGTNQFFNQLELGAGLTYMINDRLAVNIWYDAELGRKRQEQQANLEVNYQF